MWKYWDDQRAGLIGDCELAELESGLARSPGHCMTMGTASTLTAAAEALGVTHAGRLLDPGRRLRARPDGRRLRTARSSTSSGRTCRLVADPHPAEAYEDAVATVLALGGSTNAVIHLIAMAGRSGVRLTPRRLRPDRPHGAGPRQPAARRPVPDGGLPLRRRAARLPVPADRRPAPRPAHGRARHPARTARRGARPQRRRDPAAREAARADEGGVAVLRGNLCPDGAVIKHIAAEPRLLKHTGPAMVFDDYRSMQRTINDPALGITPGHVLVLRNAGPKGGPGHARVRHAADPRPPPQARSARHGADLRRPDERHVVTVRACCTSRPSRTSAGPSRSSAPEIPSPSTSRPEASISTSPTRSWRGGGPTGRRRPPATSAATAPCTANRSPRPTPAATSPSSPGRARSPDPYAG